MTNPMTTLSAGQASGRANHFLHPGLLFVGTEPTAVTTILGSCVAVCLWDEALEIGGVNHFMLPHWAGQSRQSTRFGNVAVATLIEALVTLGSTESNLRAKLVGGASTLSASGSTPSLGTRNANVAREILQAEKIPIVNEDVGGSLGRKLIFHTDDGSAWIKKL